MIHIFNQYVSPKSIFLVGLEACLIAAAMVVGVLLRFWGNTAEALLYLGAPEFALQTGAFVLVFQLCFYYCDVYDRKAQRHPAERWLCLWQALGSGSLLLGLIYFALPGLLIGRGVFFISVALVPVLVIADRLLLQKAWEGASAGQNLLLIGTGELARTVARELGEHDDLNVKLVGFVATAPESPATLDAHAVLGWVGQLQSIAAEHRISRIVVALEDRRGKLPIRDLVRLRVQGIRVEDADSMLAALSGRVWLQTVHPSWFVFSSGFRRSRLTSFAKRALDLLFATVGLVLASPFMAMIAVAIRLDSRGPVLYRQCRVGLRAKTFDVLKFRSMRLDAEAHSGAQWAIENDPRVTRVGRTLRRYRLDELPQLVNVIRGEMSFVGPRPERPVFVEQLRQEISYYDERQSVRPGLTGWAQVQYRYGATTEDARRKLEYDLFYLKNMSIFFDLAIVFKTVRIVLGGEGSR